MAKKKKGTIFDDPRYEAFVTRYHADPLRFAVEVTGFIPSGDQEHLFNGIKPMNARVSVVSGTGCFGKGTQMMLSNGDAISVEDVAVGDRLMGPDGKSVRNVLKTIKGTENLYRFTLIDGTQFVFNESHILTLAPGAKYKAKHPEIVNITVKDWLQWPKTRKERYYFYREAVECFEREESPLPVPPYILGVWLGDGTSLKPQITTMDPETDKAFSDWAISLGCTVSRSKNSENSWTVQSSRVNGTEQKNPCTKALRQIGVWGNKHIPNVYKFGSLTDRAELLAGLIDTDGYKDGTGFVFSQKDEQLAHDVMWIARSIGCHATVKPVQKTCKNTRKSGTYWTVTISRNAEKIPVRVERRKLPEGRKQRPHLLFSIKNVEPMGEGDYYGFVLDGDHRFLAHDFTVLHNTGKTASFARIALWHLLCHPVAVYEGKIEIGSNTYIGAPVIQQVADGVWKELQDTKLQISNGPHAWICDYFEITKTTVYVKGYESQWFINQIAMAAGKSVGIAGKHRYWQLIIVDEAAGVPDTHFDVIDGTQTQAGNRTLMASQGVRCAGRFYDSHHTLNKKNGGTWDALCFNSERSPFVTAEWLQARELECGGRNSIEYQIRVLGRFAQSTSNVLMTRDDIERVFEDRQIIDDDEAFGYVILSDVGLGEYRDDTVVWVARVSGNEDNGPNARRVEYIALPISSNDKNPIDLAGDLVTEQERWDNSTLYVDNGGMGAVVNKLIERSGGTVHRVDWGKPCFKNEYKSRFFNLRACAMVRFRDAVRQGRVVIRASIDKRTKEKIIDQATRLPYHFSEAGGLRYVIESKEKMRSEGIKSPDMIDAISFAFLENCHYAPASNTSLDRDSLAQKAVKNVEAMFSDV